MMETKMDTIADDLVAQRLAILNRFSAAWNAHDTNGIMAMMSQDCAFHSAAGPDAQGGRHKGQRAVRAAYDAIFATFPDAQWTNGSCLVSGDIGLSWWRFVGTTVDGKRVEVDGNDILHFDGDKISLKDSYRKQRTA